MKLLFDASPLYWRFAGEAELVSGATHYSRILSRPAGSSTGNFWRPGDNMSLAGGWACGAGRLSTCSCLAAGDWHRQPLWVVSHSRMARDSATETPLASRREVVLPAEAMKTARRERSLLRGLLAVAAGFSSRQTARPSRTPPSGEQVAFIYCVKGRGWCEAAGHLHSVRPRDRLILPPGAPHSFGPQASAPWTVHWVLAVGEHVAEYRANTTNGSQ
jgi:hypothetical protein